MISRNACLELFLIEMFNTLSFKLSTTMALFLSYGLGQCVYGRLLAMYVTCFTAFSAKLSVANQGAYISMTTWVRDFKFAGAAVQSL